MDCASPHLLYQVGGNHTADIPVTDGLHPLQQWDVAQVYDGWKITSKPGASGHATVGIGRLDTGKLGAAPNGTSSLNGIIPFTALGLTNKYATIVITFLEGYDYPNFNYIEVHGRTPDPPDLPQGYGATTATVPPAYINGLKIAEDNGAGDIELLPEFVGTRNIGTGFLFDGSEKGTRLSLTYDLSVDSDIDTESERPRLIQYYATNDMEGANRDFSFILHGFILGPDPVPAISGPIHIASPNPPIAV
jgi:hypothetical protein